MVERSRFDTVAAKYAAGRPDYPPELYATLEELLGRPLADVEVVDLGAGTGIASRQLAERGARVIAVELSASMLAELAASSPGVHAVQGSGSALPLRDDSADLVTCAQAWHWMDPGRAVPEIRRVLRPGGVFAAWWNFPTRDTEWELAQDARIDAVSPGWRHGPNPKGSDGLDTKHGLLVEEREFPWQRTITVDRFLQSLASKSYIAALPDPDAFIENERAALAPVVPGGLINERFGTRLITATEPIEPTG
jgi:SAM-dependent methyltransferase